MLTILLPILILLMTLSTLLVLFACLGAARASRWEEQQGTKEPTPLSDSVVQITITSENQRSISSKSIVHKRLASGDESDSQLSATII